MTLYGVTLQDGTSRILIVSPRIVADLDGDDCENKPGLMVMWRIEGLLREALKR